MMDSTGKSKLCSHCQRAGTVDLSGVQSVERERKPLEAPSWRSTKNVGTPGPRPVGNASGGADSSNQRPVRVARRRGATTARAP